MNSFSKIRDWFNQFDGHTLKIGTENFVLEIPLNVANIPHLLGLQYMEVKDGVSLKANEAIQYIENNSLNDRQIFIKIHKQYRKAVLARVATFKSFMENLDKGILVQNTHPSSKIRSDEFIIQIEDNKIFHLGLLNVGGISSLNSFEENLSSSKVMETYFLKKQNNYYLNSSYAEEIKIIEIRKPQEKEYIPFSFDENKNKLLLEAYHKVKSQAKTLGEVAKEKATFLVSETREGNFVKENSYNKIKKSLEENAQTKEEVQDEKLSSRERLSREINLVLDNQIDRYESIKIMDNTSPILKSIGLKDYPILMSQNHIRNCLHEKGENLHWHGLTKEDILSIPKHLENPTIIMNSFTDEKSKIIVTDTVDKDDLPIIISLKADGKGNYQAETLDSNYITSVYGKNNFDHFLQRNIEANHIIFAQKNKIQNLELFTKLQLLRAFSKDFEFDSIIHQNINNSKAFEKTSFKNFEITNEIPSEKPSLSERGNKPNLSSMLKFYKTQIKEEDSRTQDSVTKFEKRKDFER